MQAIPLIVSASELRDAPPPGVAILDCRFDLTRPAQGRADYLRGHVPGAVYVDLDHDLSAPPAPGRGRHPMPGQRQQVELFSRLGIGPDTPVVCYDEANGAFAARCWWMLRALGHRPVALLDGGLAAWRQAGGALLGGSETRERSSFRADPRRDWQVSACEVLAAPLVVDSRDPARFRGEHEPLDPVAGHIPGAVNRCFSENLDPAGRFRSPAELRGVFERLLGRVPATEAVFYCGSGVTACHNLYAMALAGLPVGRLYAGSWSEWCADPLRPVARG